MSEYIITDEQIAENRRLHGNKLLVMPVIVRCKDCKHYHAEINGCDEFGDIWHDEYANVEPDGYCAWGERKEK